MQDPQKTLEKLTKYGKNADFANHSEMMEQTEHLGGLKQATEQVAQAVKSIPQFPEKMKMELEGAEIVTIKGQKGEPGHTPTEEELLNLIKPLIPEVKDGYTPQKGIDYLTDTELKDILNLATPQKNIHYKDGRDADEQKIIKTILSKIPKPKDGENGKDAKPLDPKIIVKETIKYLQILKGDQRLSLKMFRESDDLIGSVQLHKNMMSRMPKSLLDGDQRWHGGGITSSTFIVSEIVSGSSNTFTLANIPQSGTLMLYANGQRLTPNTTIVTNDYSISGTIITTTNPWNTGNLLADYIIFGN